MSKTNVAAMPVDNTRARRLTNLENAKLLIQVGAFVFPSSGKNPLIPRFNKIDTEITPEEREAAIEEYREKHDGREPVHVGATNDAAVVKKMFKAHMDCVWSIACGPSKLVVIDADAKDNGPELIGKHFAEHGLPGGCVVVPTQSGGQHFIFKDTEGKFTNKAGLLKSKYGCDVRGKGGQYVSPGSIREDGKTYGTRKDLTQFLRAYVHGTLPNLPDHVIELIGTSGETCTKEIGESEYGPIIRELRETDWPSYDELFDPTVGIYDLESLKAKSPEFAEAYDNPSEDKSTARWQLAHALLQHVRMPVTHLATLYEGWGQGGTRTEDGKGSGNYGLRDIAKEWFKNRDRYQSDGSAMGPVDDDDAVDTDNDASKSTPPKFISLIDLLAEPATFTRWAVKNFIAFNTTYIAAGLWGSGKTAVLLDIALHIAHGLPWRGRKVQKGVVVYVALENPGDVKSRVRAWCRRNGEGVQLEDSFVLYQANATLFDPNNKGTPDERKIIKIANETATKLGLPVALIAIDTVAQAIIPGSDREHGSLFVSSMKRIAAATGANVTGLHHPTKNGDAVRGDGAFQGDTDAILLVSRDVKTGLGTIKASEQKFRIGDPRKAVFNYRLEPVKMGVDEDNEDINVVVAVEAENETWVVEDAEADARLSEAVRVAEFDEYPDYLADFMRRRTAGAGENLNGASFLSDDLRADTADALDHFANRRAASDPAKLLNQRRAQLSRALSVLEKRGMVRIEHIAGRHTVVHVLA